MLLVHSEQSVVLATGYTLQDKQSVLHTDVQLASTTPSHSKGCSIVVGTLVGVLAGTTVANVPLVLSDWTQNRPNIAVPTVSRPRSKQLDTHTGAAREGSLVVRAVKLPHS